LLAAALAPGGATAAQTPEERIELLEAKLQALTERVTVLEDQVAGAGTASADDGVVWQLGPGLGGRPLRVSHKSLDAAHGVVELLLEITAPLADPARWRVGVEAPVALTLRAPAGGERRLPMTLLRGAKLEPGAHLHLFAEIAPALLAGATQLRIELTD
jgi:hypothetical protein